MLYGRHGATSVSPLLHKPGISDASWGNVTPDHVKRRSRMPRVHLREDNHNVLMGSSILAGVLMGVWRERREGEKSTVVEVAAL
jgi:hypothetical protein